MTKTQPRFERNQRRPNAAELTRPLPPILVEQLDPATQALVEHERAAERFVELGVALPQAQVAVKRAQDEEAAAMRAAVKAGKQTPQKAKDRVAESQAALERTASDLQTVEGLLDETATTLLVAAQSRVRAAQGEANERRAKMLDAAATKLEQAVELLQAAGLVAAEGVWLAQLVERGSVAPFGARGGSTSAPGGLAETRHALAKLREGRKLEVERVEQARHDEEALNVVRSGPDSPLRRLPDPPGATVWRLPGEGDEVEVAIS